MSWLVRRSLLIRGGVPYVTLVAFFESSGSPIHAQTALAGFDVSQHGDVHIDALHRELDRVSRSAPAANRHEFRW